MSSDESLSDVLQTYFAQEKIIEEQNEIIAKLINDRLPDIATQDRIDRLNRFKKGNYIKL